MGDIRVILGYIRVILGLYIGRMAKAMEATI